MVNTACIRVLLIITKFNISVIFDFLNILYFQRRWVVVSNPGLCDLITKWLRTDAWIREVDLLLGLREHVENKELQLEWRTVNPFSSMFI